MIRIESIRIEVQTVGPAFHGEITFLDGLNVVSAENGFGKSLACTAIAWCLRLEPLYGVGDSDARLFKDAVNQTVDDELGGQHKVQSSRATLRVVRRSDGLIAEFSRSIHGGDPKIVNVVEMKGQDVILDVKLDARGAQDEVAGFQAYLTRFLNFPVTQLMRATGKPAILYFQNIAPYFFIEQMRGWVDVSATQVHRYRLVEVNAAAVEYLLGADEKLAARFREQTSSARESELRATARAIAADVDAALARSGWSIDLSAVGTLTNISKRWSDTNLKATLRDRYNVDFERERARLHEVIEHAQATLAGETTFDSPPVDAASRQVQELKERREVATSRVAVLRLQHVGTQSTLDEVEARLRSTKDLLRLKRSHIGILEKSACPMCEQEVSTAKFGFDDQGFAQADLQVEASERDRAVLKQALAEGAEEINGGLVELQVLSDALRSAQRSLNSTLRAQGDTAERLAKAAHDLADGEAALERSILGERMIDDLQKRVHAWCAENAKEASTEGNTDSDQARIDHFAKWLRTDLVATGHTAMKSGGTLKLDDEYRPSLNGRELRAQGAGSDPARLVLAYSTALLRSAIENGGHHPGVLIADEPQQQNPDKKHEQLAATFWKALAPWLTEHGGQAIVFTFLAPKEVEELKRGGVAVRDLGQGKLLRAVRTLGSG